METGYHWNKWNQKQKRRETWRFLAKFIGSLAILGTTVLCAALGTGMCYALAVMNVAQSPILAGAFGFLGFTGGIATVWIGALMIRDKYS